MNAMFPAANPSRRAALMAHSLPKGDQAWLLDALPPSDRDETRARSLRRRTRALLHGPTVAARAAARVGDAAGYARALADLAAIDVPDVSPAAA